MLNLAKPETKPLPWLCSQFLHTPANLWLPSSSHQPLSFTPWLLSLLELISASTSEYCHYFSLLVPQSMHKVPHYAAAYGFHQEIVIIFLEHSVKHFSQFRYFMIVAVPFGLYTQNLSFFKMGNRPYRFCTTIGFLECTCFSSVFTAASSVLGNALHLLYTISLNKWLHIDQIFKCCL